MMPFYFGPSDRTVFGAFHPPAGQSIQHGVVVCHPFGHEYLRAFQVCRRLALSLSNAGLPTLRFDYFGTGDSAGENHEGTLRQWREDIVTAVRELRDMTGVPRISLIGVRLGATLAATLHPTDIEIAQLVLWDPVTDGRAYIERLSATHTGALQYTHPRVRHISRLNGDREALGAIMSRQLLGELQRIDLCGIECTPCQRVCLAVSEERPEYVRLRRRLESHQVQVQYDVVPIATAWEPPHERGTAVLAPEMIQRITARLIEM